MSPLCASQAADRTSARLPLSSTEPCSPAGRPAFTESPRLLSHMPTVPTMRVGFPCARVMLRCPLRQLLSSVCPHDDLWRRVWHLHFTGRDADVAEQNQEAVEGRRTTGPRFKSQPRHLAAGSSCRSHVVACRSAFCCYHSIPETNSLYFSVFRDGIHCSARQGDTLPLSYTSPVRNEQLKRRKDLFETLLL